MKGDLHGDAYIDAVLNLDALVHNVGVLVENHALLPLTDRHTNQNRVEHLVIMAHGHLLLSYQTLI